MVAREFIEAQTDRRLMDIRLQHAAWEFCIREVLKAFPPRTMSEDAIESRLPSLDSIEPLSRKGLFVLKFALTCINPYHPDKIHKEDDEEWACLAEYVTRVGQNLLDIYAAKVRAGLQIVNVDSHANKKRPCCSIICSFVYI